MKYFLLALVATVFALLVSEIVLRALGIPVYYTVPGKSDGMSWEDTIHQKSIVPGLDYELRPGAKGVLDGVPLRINSLGFRGEEMDTMKNPGDKIIAVLGDSITFGIGVESRDTYANVLERLLSREFPGRSFKGLNFGVSGYSSRDEALALRHKAARFSPDLVIIGYCLNDPEIDPVQPLHSFFHDPSWWQHSNFLSMLVWAKDNAEIKFMARGDYLRLLHQKERKWQSVIHAFEDMGAWSRDNQVPVIVLVFPVFVPPYTSWPDEYTYHDIHHKVSEACKDAGLEVIDLYDVFSPYPAGELTVSIKDAHPNEFAHELVASRIVEHLKKYYPGGF